MASRRRDTFPELRRSGRDRHAVYNSLDENSMQNNSLFRHILNEANKAHHHELYDASSSPTRRRASGLKEQAPALNTNRSPIQHQLPLEHNDDEEEEEDEEFGDQDYSKRAPFRLRPNSNTREMRHKRRSGHDHPRRRFGSGELAGESLSPTPQSDEEVADENRHNPRRAVPRTGTSPNKASNPSSLKDGQRRSSNRLLVRSVALMNGAISSASTDYNTANTKEEESDEYVVDRKTLQALEKVDSASAGGANGVFSPTMYERVKRRRQSTRVSNQTVQEQYMNDDTSKSSSSNSRRHRNEQQQIAEEYHHRPTRSRMLREGHQRVITDEEDDENSRETVDGLGGPQKSGTGQQEGAGEEEEEMEEEEEDTPRQYHFRQRRAQPGQMADGERPMRNCRIVSSANANVVGYNRGVDGRRMPMSNSKHSSRRGSSRHHPRQRRRRLDNDSSGSSSTSSSDDDEQHRPNELKSAKQDARQEARFERRKLKSMEKGRRNLMPMNLTEKEITSASLTIREKLRKLGSSCADIDPMQVGKAGFEEIGGLERHIQSLKEVVLFPMLYPELFQQFDISPPKGVLFYGPPGTGKTLVARALANECSKGDQKVAFFMRKGADCLSKWVGESERQLRLLFDQAYAMRPSIIFFDEIDGLAPVRSSRQDQIHSSIVSTLLALMDGLDKRGEIIVIGATNRLDSIDPALRRPGRFDREMRFDLPDKMARESIIKIHTSAWKESKPDDELLHWLADRSSGYCGADLKALCTEAVLIATRKRFPHIYLSSEKLVIDPAAVRINQQHFLDSIRQIVPAARRDFSVISHQMNERTSCFIEDVINSIVSNKIPKEYVQRTGVENLFSSDLERVVMGLKAPPSVPAARLLIHGNGQLGQTTHFLPVLVNRLDHLSVFSLSSEKLFSSGPVEENVSQAIRSALRATSQGNAVLVLLPDIDVLELTLPTHIWKMLVSSLHSFTGFTSALVIASIQQHYKYCSEDVKQTFRFQNSVEIKHPSEAQRKTYFKNLLDNAFEKPVEFNPADYPQPPKAAKDVAVRKVNAAEFKELKSSYEQMLRQLRIYLRDILGRLVRDRRFSAFNLPVDKEDAEDYYDIITDPMCLSQMMYKIDHQDYLTKEAFMEDIRLITHNALEYNPDKDMDGKTMRHNAMCLVDTAEALFFVEYEDSFSEKLEEYRKLLEEAKLSQVAEPQSAPPTINTEENGLALAQPPNAPVVRTVQANQQLVQKKVIRKGRKGKKRRVAMNNTVGILDSKRKRTAAAPAVQIVKKYKLQKSNSTRSQKFEEEDDTYPSARKNSPPMLEDVAETQDSLPVPEVAQQPQERTTPRRQSGEGKGSERTPNKEKFVEMDKREVHVVLSKCVHKTHNWSIPDIECLGAELTRCIEQYLKKWDRRELPRKLEHIIESFLL